VENTGAETYGKLSIQKFLTVKARIRMCLIANGRQSPISGNPNRTNWPGSWSRRVGVIHFDVLGRIRLRGSNTPSLYSLVVFSYFCGRVCNAYDNYSRMLVYSMIWLLVRYLRTFICVSVCRTLMPFRIVIRNLSVYLRYVGRRTVNFPRLYRMYIYFRTYMFFYLLNYITSLNWKLSDNYKHGCRK